MLGKEEFHKELMHYVRKQDHKRLGVHVVRREVKPETKQGIIDSIEQRRALAERTSFGKGDHVPFFQRKIVKTIFSPFMMIYEPSRPEDFRISKPIVREIEGPRESRAMGIVNRIGKSFEKPVPEKRVRVLLKETQTPVNMAPIHHETQAISRNEKSEYAVEEISRTEEREQKGLLNKKPTTYKDKHQLVKQYMLDELRGLYNQEVI